MAIKTGERIPSVTLRYMADDGIKEITTDELFGGSIFFAIYFPHQRPFG